MTKSKKKGSCKPSSAGINDLPIVDFKDEIMGSSAPYIIVEAETGSGKSTMVPQWFHELDMSVLVTEPLIETVIGTSEYVAQLMGCEFGSTVGYRTGSSRCDSRETDVLFCTDGLALVRELSGHNRFDVLVIDELHEWNTNQSTLEAWAWKHLQAGDSPFQKIVVLSATLNSDELSRKRGNAPVFKVPGRQFPIEDRRAGSSIEADVKSLVAEGHDVLVFQPGANEIRETIQTLERMEVNAELIPFYGKLSREDKTRAYRSYGRSKVVVSTNALETGRTLVPSPGRKLAVVDSGLEKRVELDNDGIEGLYLEPIAKAKAMQRRGRTGRVGEGIYIDHCPSAGRPAYPVPEILRTRLDQTVLRLACHGYDATELPFFHELDMSVIAEAKRALQALGAMREDGDVTKTGRLMSRLPVSVGQARMIIEADKRGVVDDVITIAAILNVKGICDRTGAWRAYTVEKRSDVLVELDLWQAARGKRNRELRDMGIFAKDYQRARQIRRKLVDVLRQHRVKLGSSGDREEILKSVCAGMVDHLYKFSHTDRMGNWYVNGGSSTARLLGNQSVVDGGPDWLVAIGFNVPTRKGGTLPIVTQVTAVEPMWLAEVAPQLVEVKTGLSPRYDQEKDLVTSVTEMYFNGQKVREERVDDPTHPEAARLFAQYLASRNDVEPMCSNCRQANRMKELNIRAGEDIFPVPDMASFYQERLNGARSIQEIEPGTSLRLPTLDEELVKMVMDENPDTIQLLGEELTVEYRAPYYGQPRAPRVKLTDELVSTNRWLELPDEGVWLPSGRSVELVVSFGHYNELSGTDIPKLKVEMRDYLNRKQWDSWVKPEIEIPDLSADDAVVPFVTKVYGTCVTTGDELMAYGTIAVNTSRWYASDPLFKAMWYRDLIAAQNAADASAEKLVEKKDELKAARALELAKTEAEAARKELQNLKGREDWEELEYDLRSRVSDLLYRSLPRSIDELREDIESTKALIAEVESALEKFENEREAEEQRLLEAEERGEILRDFEAWHRRGGMTGNGDGWVIRPDGSLRDRDSDTVPRYKHDGQYHWDMVKPEELALSWRCSTRRDVDGTSDFKVVKVPVDGVTSEQLRRVEEIEDGIGASRGAFGLHAEITRRNEERLEACREAALNARVRGSQILRKLPETFSWLKLAGDGVLNLEHYVEDRNVFRYVNWAAEYVGVCDNRDAFLLFETTAADGKLQFVVYEKYGSSDNLAVRWREFTEEELAQQAEHETPQGDGHFVERSTRHFACDCGGTTRITKSEWKRYRRGEVLELTCTHCGATGTVCKEADEEPEAKQNGNGSSGGGASMADLMAKFNR
ncbi:MAG: DEAD/DEAH box helicase [Candidatus Magasanikbacteria bacterium]|nr:DEAD/DEAH box helicase [Candidatus Magasanikbacteria bacterium]